MNNLNVVVALTTKDNDYQAEQSASAAEVASRLGVKIRIAYADNDAVNQSQQLVQIIQDKTERPDAILVEPVGTAMPQVAKAAVAAGIGWGILNREADYIAELRRDTRIPVFAVSPDQEEVGRIQAKQLAALTKDGNVLYIEGPSSSSAANLRSKGMLSTKPAGVMMKMLKGDWSERSAHHTVKSWLSLSTSKELQIQAVVCQNNAMAMGARKTLVDLSEAERERWLQIPFLGCDGVTKTGQEWVGSGQLRGRGITTVARTPISAMLGKDRGAHRVRSAGRAPVLTALRSISRASPAIGGRSGFDRIDPRLALGKQFS
jgi:ribose transport system substrate-binding protein